MTEETIKEKVARQREAQQRIIREQMAGIFGRPFNEASHSPPAGVISTGFRPSQASSCTAALIDAEGLFPVDQQGFVESDGGGPIKFGHQVEAIKWVAKQGNKISPTQIYEVANYPDCAGSYTVKVCGRYTGTPRNIRRPSNQL